MKWLRDLRCYKCWASPCDGAHIRKYTDGGTATKPSDKYALPLCRPCHSLQHRIGELTFYGGEKAVRQAIKYAEKLWNASVLCGRAK